MPKRIVRISRSRRQILDDRHRFEHWLVDNQVYFITCKCKDGFPAFETEKAKEVSWDRFTHWTKHFTFTPWATSLMNNHYHTIGYLKLGENLSAMMQKFHGSVAKLVNDALEVRLKPIWRDSAGKAYFDGCIRNEKQARRAYGYILRQAVRARLVKDWKEYSHTRVNVELERAIARSHELGAFLDGRGYKRYRRRSK